MTLDTQIPCNTVVKEQSIKATFLVYTNRRVQYLPPSSTVKWNISLVAFAPSLKT